MGLRTYMDTGNSLRQTRKSHDFARTTSSILAIAYSMSLYVRV